MNYSAVLLVNFPTLIQRERERGVEGEGGGGAVIVSPGIARGNTPPLSGGGGRGEMGAVPRLPRGRQGQPVPRGGTGDCPAPPTPGEAPTPGAAGRGDPSPDPAGGPRRVTSPNCDAHAVVRRKERAVEEW